MISPMEDFSRHNSIVILEYTSLYRLWTFLSATETRFATFRHGFAFLQTHKLSVR